MTLLIAAAAAIISTIVWYFKDDGSMKTGTLVLIYWGATLMWLVDAVSEYLSIGAAYFTPEPIAMLNDAFLGLSVVILGLIIWLIILLIKDPKGKIKKTLTQK